MRQTSRAVALLLLINEASAAATVNAPVPTDGVAYSPNSFNPDVSAEGAPTNALQLNSRTAGYLNANRLYAPSEQSPVWTDATMQKAQAVAGTVADAVGVVGSGCMQCLNGKGVWCSRTYSYLSSSTGFQFQITAKTSSLQLAIIVASEPLLVAGVAQDSGSCCATSLNFALYVGTKKTPTPVMPTNVTAPSKLAAGLPFVQGSCVAVTNASYVATGGAEAFGVSTVEASQTAYSSWWCSNGLYKNVTGGSASTLNAQQVIPQGVNKRLELAQVGCPNQKVMCGIPAATIVADLDTTTPSTFTLPATGGPTVNDKCTWVAWSVKTGPSFTLNESVNLGLSGSNWQLHAMEYTSASSYVAAAGSLNYSNTAGYRSNNSALQFTNYVPIFAMPADQFATLRTWYGEGTMVLDPVSSVISTWLSPGAAPISNLKPASTSLAGVKTQTYGNVANVGVSNYILNTDLTAVGNFNYGQYNSLPYDLRQVRYFPAQVAQTVWAAGDALKTQYTTALTKYNIAKTNWDAYVAILDKNAKQDAFAAMFSPPKAPTVPPLPNSPWLPATYSGYSRATAQQVKGFQSNTVAKQASSPTAGQFWSTLAAAQTVGGWGSFTAQVLRFRNGWGKSFGTIGYSGDSDNLKMSVVWNYMWTCTAAGSGPVTTSPCDATYAVATPGDLATSSGNTSANAVKMISVVSLWSTANSATAVTKFGWGSTFNGLQIVFTAGAWSSTLVALVPITAPTAAVAAKSLSGIAGAQALAASTAAALAVAAALY